MIATAVAIAILSQPAPVPMTYMVAECSTWPLEAAQVTSDGLKVATVAKRPTRITTLVKAPITGLRSNLVAHRIGSRELGWIVWSIRAPEKVAVLIAESKSCRITGNYKTMRTWDKALVAWIQERSTCYGEATWRGRAYTVWPCEWSTSRITEGVVKTLSGVGPGVMSGGSGAVAAGLVDTKPIITPIEVIK